MEKSRTSSFIVEAPLRASSSQEKQLLTRLEAARQVYNACLGESLKRLDLLRQSKAYQAARRLPKGLKESAAKEKAHTFRKANAAAGFREYDLHAYAAQFNHCWIGEHLDINTIQKLATRAFGAVQQHALGRRGCPRFKGRDQMDSVEGKSNASGIRWRDDHVEWLGLTLSAIIDPDDPVIAHGLSSHVKYVRLVRRKIGERNRFYTQLICEGRPYQKPKNRVGKGEVGLDIGPSTIAIVGDREAFLKQFCAELRFYPKEIRRLQRHIDRQRRANNPDNYNPDGTVKPGVKVWRKSRRQRQEEARLAELYRRQAAYRKSLHGQLANRTLRMGDVIKLEKLSYRSFQRRFGKSSAACGPGIFVEHLKRRAEGAGAKVVEFPTHTTRSSRVCHNCGTVAKKPLSERWHICDCGVIAQRDLYSAFLAKHIEGERLDAGRAQAAWPGADLLLQAALSRIKQPANGRLLPSSFGLKTGQRQSRPPVKTGMNTVEAQDAVPSVASATQGRA